MTSTVFLAFELALFHLGDAKAFKHSLTKTPDRLSVQPGELRGTFELTASHPHTRESPWMLPSLYHAASITQPEKRRNLGSQLQSIQPPFLGVALR